ncbi:MAG: acyl-CoA dehydrogenase [Candidatus Thermoplasmatota archaeon]
MDFELTEEQKMIKNMARDFAENEVRPIAAEIDEEDYFPWDLINKAGDLGFMGMTVPEEYGGAGIDRISYILVLEEISRVSGGMGLTLEAHNSLGVGHIYERGTEEQKEKYLPNLTSGEAVAAWALTEPNAGSDAASIETTAEKEGDEWVIDGTKQFITSGSLADVVIVMAKTEKGKGAKGISAFIVEEDNPGLEYGVEENKLGMRGSVTSELFFEECRVPEENMLDEEGRGFIGAMDILDRGRTAISALALGIAQGALDESIDYSKQREQFGRPISKFQAIQWKIADMATEIEAARLLTYRAACLEDEGKDFGKEASMAKLFTSETSSQVAREAIQILGGYGYTKEYPVERFFRDAKLCEIGEGTSEVQRRVIAKHLGL